jgi:Flp pilus assembly pilin Flp
VEHVYGAFRKQSQELRNPMKQYISQRLHSVLAKEEGTTTTEYALMIALILVFCLAALLSTGGVQQAIWFDTANTIESAIVP